MPMMRKRRTVSAEQSLLECIQGVRFREKGCPQNRLWCVTLSWVEKLLKQKRGNVEDLQLFASKRAWKAAQKIKRSGFYKHRASTECMVDVYVTGRLNEHPFGAVATAESEGYEHQLTLKNGRPNPWNDYAWDFFKLLQVPSPLRVFVARCRQDDMKDLKAQCVTLVSKYGKNIKGDRLLIGLLPSFTTRPYALCGKRRAVGGRVRLEWTTLPLD
jgi:hypothetical protein